MRSVVTGFVIYGLTRIFLLLYLAVFMSEDSVMRNFLREHEDGICLMMWDCGARNGRGRAKQAGAGSPVGAWQSLVMNANVASLILPYVSSHRHWIMFAARTNKAFSVHLDKCRHWDERFKQLLMDLRSGRARFEVQRYVSCSMTDCFYWDPKDNLDGIYFTISVLPESTL